MKKIYIVLLALLYSNYLPAQKLILEHTQFISVDGCFSDCNRAVATSDKGMVMTGQTTCSGKGPFPLNGATNAFGAFVAKMDSNRNFEWVKVFGGSGGDEGIDVIQTRDGGYAVLANSSSSDGDVTNPIGSADAWLLRLDVGGNLLWSENYGSPSPETPWAITETESGGFLILGNNNYSGYDIPFHYGTSPFLHDWFLIKTDSLGNRIWSKVFGGMNDESGQKILAVDNYYYLVGTSNSTDYECNDTSWHSSGTDTKFNYYVLKLDTAGNLIWSKSYGGSKADGAYSAIWDDRDNTIVINGYTLSNDYMVQDWHDDPDNPWDRDDAFVVKIDTSGKLIWAKCLGGFENERGTNIIKGPGGGYVVYSSTSQQIKGSDSWLFILDSNGNVLTDKVIGGTGGDIANNILSFGSGYVVTGLTSSGHFIEGTNGPKHSGQQIYVSYLHYFPASVSDVSHGNTQLKIVPNPTSGVVRIFLPSGVEDKKGIIVITDNVGKTVYRQRISKEGQYIDVETVQLARGLFHVSYKEQGRAPISATLIIQ